MARRRPKSIPKLPRATVGREPLRRRGQRSVPATEARNRFGEILQAARAAELVFIERHGQPQAVVLGIEAYEKLTANERTAQERELDALHARMQTCKARQAVDALLSATDAMLNRTGA